MKNKHDVSREGLTIDKIKHFGKTLLYKESTMVLMAVSRFGYIDFRALLDMGKRGIILDVDECIAPHHGNITSSNLKTIINLLDIGFRIVIFSNMKKNERYDELEKIGVKVITSEFAKPDKRGFEECLKSLGMTADKVVMIGDNYITDGGCRYAGIDFIKVKPIETKGEMRNIKRLSQLAFRNLVDTIAAKVHKTLTYR